MLVKQKSNYNFKEFQMNQLRIAFLTALLIVMQSTMQSMNMFRTRIAHCVFGAQMLRKFSHASHRPSKSGVRKFVYFSGAIAGELRQLRF